MFKERGQWLTVVERWICNKKIFQVEFETCVIVSHNLITGIFFPSIIDQGLTKGMILILCSKMITVEETAQLLLENLYKQFRLPDKLLSNRGPQFASKSFRELLKLLGIKSSLSTAYHPQMDRTTE